MSFSLTILLILNKELMLIKPSLKKGPSCILRVKNHDCGATPMGASYGDKEKARKKTDLIYKSYFCKKSCNEST